MEKNTHSTSNISPSEGGAKLYVVPTPIGNLEDMTFRAIRILKGADLILAEDTRTSGFLLKHFEIKTPMHSHHKFNEHKTVENIVQRIKGGQTIALISDAGTPAISDPGFLVVRQCVENGIEIIKGLRGFTSGYAIPNYVIDAPGGGGKIPLLPEYYLGKNKGDVLLKNYENKTFRYPDYI